MSDFTDLIARAVDPSMSRDQRESVYTLVRDAIRQMQERQQMPPSDPQAELQRHLVEETIRDIETDIARYLAYARMDEVLAVQDGAPRPGGRSPDDIEE